MLQNASRREITLSRQLFWAMLFLLLLASALITLAYYLFSADWLRINQELPVSLRSPMKANYGVDALQLPLAPLEEHILADALNDQPQATEITAQLPVNQLATLVNPLLTPVPTVTPWLRPTLKATMTPLTAGETPQPGVTMTLWRTSTATPTILALTATTAVRTPTFQPTATRTLMAQATATAVRATGTAYPTATAARNTPTSIVKPPQATPTLLRPSPTSGRINTQVPTQVPTRPPAPTSTPAPPKPTSPPPPQPTAYPPPPSEPEPTTPSYP